MNCPGWFFAAIAFYLIWGIWMLYEIARARDGDDDNNDNDNDNDITKR